MKHADETIYIFFSYLSAICMLCFVPGGGEVLLNVLRCQLTYQGQVVTNAEARFNKSLRPWKPEGLLERTAQDGHLDSHTAPELSPRSVLFNLLCVWILLTKYFELVFHFQLCFRPPLHCSHLVCGTRFASWARQGEGLFLFF